MAQEVERRTRVRRQSILETDRLRSVYKKAGNPKDDSGVNVIAEEFEGHEVRLDSIEVDEKSMKRIRTNEPEFSR